MDQKYALMIDAINSFSYAQRLRDEEKNIRKEDRDMWRHNKKLQISQELRKNTRILVCGQTGVGKSKLINVVLDKNVVRRSQLNRMIASVTSLTACVDLGSTWHFCGTS